MRGAIRATQGFVLGFWALLFASLAARRAAAESACAHGPAVGVRVTFSPGTWPKGLRETAFEDLQAGLQSRGIVTCRAAEESDQRALASIVISSHGADSVSVSVEIHDAVTNKRVSRELDLTSIPVDGRALALALAADELVWASWAEIGLRDNQRRTLAPAPLVREVERKLAVSESKTQRLGLQVAAEHFGRGQAHLGPDLSYSSRLFDRFGLVLLAGLRWAPETDATDGRVQTTTMGIGFELETRLTSNRRIEFAWLLGARASWVRFEGEAHPGAVDRELTGIAAYVRTGPVLAVRAAGPIWLGIGAGLGLPLKSIEATDAGRVVTGVAGIEESARLSVSWEL